MQSRDLLDLGLVVQYSVKERLELLRKMILSSRSITILIIRTPKRYMLPSLLRTPTMEIEAYFEPTQLDSPLVQSGVTISNQALSMVPSPRARS